MSNSGPPGPPGPPSFASRRAAAGALPAFTLPPPNADIPRSSDGQSPSLSSVNTGSSQGSQAAGGATHANQYTYGHVHGAWPTPSSSTYHVSSATQHQPQPPPLASMPFGARNPMYSHQPNMSLNGHRSSQSPATGAEGLPPPPYDQVHPPFQTSFSGGGGNGGQHGPHGSILQPQSSAEPTTSSAPAPIDPYAHTRAPSAPSYHMPTSGPPGSNFSPYASHQSPTQAPSHMPPRGLGSLAGHSGMAPPTPYRQYPYPPMPTMSGPVLSNMHQPGQNLAMVHSMAQGPYGHHPMMYAQGQPQAQTERPFKCDQCTQSFSRNHDLKRHKRIHLAVKPFPCSFCSKSFSRKDALKRHRLVKGCEGKLNENPSPEESTADQEVD